MGPLYLRFIFLICFFSFSRKCVISDCFPLFNGSFGVVPVSFWGLLGDSACGGAGRSRFASSSSGVGSSTIPPRVRESSIGSGPPRGAGLIVLVGVRLLLFSLGTGWESDAKGLNVSN